MGKFDFTFDEELTRQLERMADVDRIAPKILNGAIPILKQHVIKICDKHARTRQLTNSIKKTTAVKNKYGWWVCVRPTGKSNLYKTVKGKTGTRKEPVRNMEIMAHLEYGYEEARSGKHVAPIPILTKAINTAKKEVTDKMQEIYNEEVGK